MRVKIILSVIFLTSSLALSQVGGISGGKLSIPDAGIIEQGTLEFEPSFSVSHSNYFFGTNGNSHSLYGQKVNSSFLFRITVGITENLEIGSSIPSTMEQIDFGAKQNVLSTDNLGLAITGGVSLPAGNKFISDSLSNNAGNYMASFGGTLSNKFNDIITLDIAFSYKRIFGANFYHNAISLGGGFGYRFSKSFQGVVELNSISCFEQKICSGKISASSGFTYKVTSSMLFVAGLGYDFLGKNDYQNLSYFSAFTISLK